MLSEPYADQSGTNGVAIFTEAELRHWVQKARQADMPIAAHAIGDLAFEYVLNAIEALPPKDGLHDRLIHAQIVRPELLERAVKLPVIFDIQPGFVPSDFPWVEEKVPAKLLASSYAWKTYLNMGITCAGGSDAPIEPLNQFWGSMLLSRERKSMVMMRGMAWLKGLPFLRHFLYIRKGVPRL